MKMKYNEPQTEVMNILPGNSLLSASNPNGFGDTSYENTNNSSFGAPQRIWRD